MSLLLALILLRGGFMDGKHPTVFAFPQFLSLHLCPYCSSSFLPFSATAQGELWPPEQSASILSHPRLSAWFLNDLVFMV
jgi:hypothetical protein